MKQIQLFGSSTKSLSAFVSAQSRVNTFYEKIDDDEKGVRIFFRDFPGDTLAFDLPYANARGVLAVENVAYMVADAFLLRLRPNGTYDVLGTVGSSVTGRVSLAWNGSQLMIVLGNEAFIYDSVANTITVPTGFEYPSNSVIFTNGFFMANKTDTSNFYISNLFDGSTWEGKYSQMVVNPDPLQALDALHGTVVGYGTSSIEFWQDNGSSPFPFAQLSGTAQNIGLVAPFSRAFINNTFCFLGTNLAGQVQVYAFNAGTPVAISDSSIENIINSFGTVADAEGIGFSKDGHPLFLLTFPSADRSFLYDFTSGVWSYVQTGVGDPKRYYADFSFVMNNEVYMVEANGANIYKLKVGTYQHAGEAMKRQMTSKKLEVGGDQFTIDEMWMDLDIGTVPAGLTPSVFIECSKDDGNTWPMARTVYFAKGGEYAKPRLITYRWGTARNFTFRFTFTDNVPAIIVRASAVISQGQT
jgi:hypothetical protein